MGCFAEWSVCSGDSPAFTAPPRAMPGCTSKSRLLSEVLGDTVVPAVPVFAIFQSSSMSGCYQVLLRRCDPPGECVSGPQHAISIQRFIRWPRNRSRSSYQSGTFQAAMLACSMMTIVRRRGKCAPRRLCVKMYRQYLHKNPLSFTVELSGTKSYYRKHGVTEGANRRC